MSQQPQKQLPLSSCHKAVMTVGGDSDGTRYYVCSTCGNLCDPYVEQPKPCTRNYTDVGDHTVRVRDGVNVCTGCGLPVAEHGQPNEQADLREQIHELLRPVADNGNEDVCDALAEAIPEIVQAVEAHQAANTEQLVKLLEAEKQADWPSDSGYNLALVRAIAIVRGQR